MTDPINPYTTLQMTMEVERLQHIKHTQPAQEQGTLAQEMNRKKALEQEKVNKHEKTEKERIRDENSDNKNRQGRDDSDRENSDDDNESERGYDKEKGNIIDIKI